MLKVAVESCNVMVGTAAVMPRRLVVWPNDSTDVLDLVIIHYILVVWSTFTRWRVVVLGRAKRCAEC